MHLEEEFKQLEKESAPVYKSGKVIPCESHKSKNRYKNIAPLQVNMTTLDGNGYNGPNYFNGNYILGKSGNVDFIATQGPLEKTVEDFWNVVMLNGVSSVVGREIYQNLFEFARFI